MNPEVVRSNDPESVGSHCIRSQRPPALHEASLVTSGAERARLNLEAQVRNLLVAQEIEHNRKLFSSGEFQERMLSLLVGIMKSHLGKKPEVGGVAPLLDSDEAVLIEEAKLKLFSSAAIESQVISNATTRWRTPESFKESTRQQREKLRLMGIEFSPQAIEKLEMSEAPLVAYLQKNQKFVDALVKIAETEGVGQITDERLSAVIRKEYPTREEFISYRSELKPGVSKVLSTLVEALDEAAGLGKEVAMQVKASLEGIVGLGFDLWDFEVKAHADRIYGNA